jgi:hypothetical protein
MTENQTFNKMNWPDNVIRNFFNKVNYPGNNIDC